MSAADKIIEAKMKMLALKCNVGMAQRKRDEVMGNIFVLIEDIRQEVHNGILSQKSNELGYHLELNRHAKEECDQALLLYEDASANYQALCSAEI